MEYYDWLHLTYEQDHAFHLDKGISEVLGRREDSEGADPWWSRVPAPHTSAMLPGPLVFSSAETIYLWKIQTQHISFTVLLCVKHTMRLLLHV